MPTPSLAGFTAPLRRTGVLAATLALLLAAAGPIRAQDKDQGKDPLIAKVNGTEIHQSDLTIAEEEAGQIPPMPEKEKRDYLVQFVADMIVVSKAAEAKKLGDTPDFKRKVTFARNKLLMESLLTSTGKAALTDDAMHKVYDNAIKSMGDEQEVRARHILIRAPANDEKASKAAEDKIKAVIVRLKAGEDFAKVAAEVTEDPSGKTNGGDLGYFTKEQMVPEFADVAFSLDKGKISDPVKTQFGWHVIQVEDKRTKPAPKFEEVKSQIEKYVVQKAQTDMVIGLRKEAKIERFDEAAKTDATPDATKPAAKVDAKPDAKPAKKK
jgi:peptidyl-prolyl cis-trans isomerase C